MAKPPAQPSTPVGEVVIDGDSGTLLFKRYLPHPPEAVWAALTEPEQLREWFMTIAVIDGRLDGWVHMITTPARFHWTGRILAWDPPHIYEYNWNIEPRPEIPRGERSVVCWQLTSLGDGTILDLKHQHLSKRTAIGFAPGTHTFLDRLAAHLDKQPLPDWMARYTEVQHAYPAWRARI